MTSNQQKYYKYKNKYLEIKQRMNNMNNYERRGGANIFDLSKEYNFTDNVQKNIASLYEMFGESFSIRNETSVMPVN